MDRLDPTLLLRDIEHLKLLYPDIWAAEGDRPLVLQTETTFDEFMHDIAAEILRTKGELLGTRSELEDLAARRKRLEDRGTAMRELCMKVMNRADITNWKTPRATMFIRNGTPSVHVSDKSALPPDCLRAPEPNLEAIGKRLKNGDTIPGAELNNSPPSLTVRSK